MTEEKPFTHYKRVEENGASKPELKERKDFGKKIPSTG
jgi:hypothetical protein